MYGTKKKTTIVATEHVYVCMSSMCAIKLAIIQFAKFE